MSGWIQAAMQQNTIVERSVHGQNFAVIVLGAEYLEESAQIGFSRLLVCTLVRRCYGRILDGLGLRHQLLQSVLFFKSS